MEERIFCTIIKEVCHELNINVQSLSYDWIMQLSKDGVVRHITGNRFDLNPEATGDIACDKFATYEVLNSQNVQVIEHKMLFNPTARQKYISDDGVLYDAFKYFMENKPVVVKPNNGCEGQGVSLCSTAKEFEYAIMQLFKHSGSISICPYYSIDTEYRTFYLDGECYLIYGKTKPYVTGDGIHNISELIINLHLPDNSIVDNNLSKLDMEYVPELGEKVEISWKHNLSGGATPAILEKGKLYDKIRELVFLTGKAMNIKFATIDVILTNSGELYVMEVNSGVCMTQFIEQTNNGYEIAKKYTKKQLRNSFEMFSGRFIISQLFLTLMLTPKLCWGVK